MVKQLLEELSKLPKQVQVTVFSPRQRFLHRAPVIDALGAARWLHAAHYGHHEEHRKAAGGEVQCVLSIV
jgi:hypothetical protein